MRTEAVIMQVLEAVQQADPNHEDDALEMLNDTLRWVIGYDASTVQEFIRHYISG